MDLLGERGAPIEVLVHGTTVATNALLERRGAGVALVTTAGFEDLLWLRRQDRPALYDLAQDRMVIFGGQDAFGRHNLSWALSLAGDPVWSEVNASYPRPAYRDSHSAIYDPVRGRMVIFG